MKRSLSRSRRWRPACSLDCPRRGRGGRPRRSGGAPPVPRGATRPLHAGRSRRAERDRPRGARRALRDRRPVRRLQRTLLDEAALDAIVVCSPAGTHAECDSRPDSTRGCTSSSRSRCASRSLMPTDRRRSRPSRSRRPGRDDEALRPRVRGMLAELPDSAVELRYVSVVVNDPEFEPYFVPGEIVRGTDVPRELIESTRRSGGRAGRGRGRLGDPTSSVRFPRAFSAACCTTSTSCTDCSSNWASRCPAEVIAGDWWNEGRAVAGSLASRTEPAATAPGSGCSAPSNTARRSRSSLPIPCTRSRFPRRG